MKLTTRAFTLVTLSAFSIACADQATVMAPDAPQFARGGPTAPNPQLRFTFAPGGSFANDRADEYAGGECGVFAEINNATSDALLDPDRNYSSVQGACGPRRIWITMPGAATAKLDGPYITIEKVGQVSTTSPGRVGFATDRSKTGCEYIRFGYDDMNKRLPISRNADGSWTVVATDQVPDCWNTVRGKIEKKPLAAMPFALTLSPK